MDSLLTLVYPSPPTYFEFDRNGVLNATLLKNSQPTYTIQTKQTATARTEVVDVTTQKVIVVIEENGIFPDTVRISSVNGGKAIKISKWMKEERLLDKTRVRVIETAYRRYLWKVHVVHRLALYAESNLETPVAYIKPATRTSPLVIVVESEAMGLIDQIIASLIIREKELR
ncbi:uncharacterized protein EV420DRAFT_1240321, partial [Desarmillaria tabescens]